MKKPTPIPVPETPVPAPVTPIPGDLHTPVLSRRTVVMGLGLSIVGLAGVGGYLYWRENVPKTLTSTSTSTRPPSTSRVTPVPQGTVFVTYHGHVLPVYTIA